MLARIFNRRQDADEVAELVAAVGHISTGELPDPAARAALVAAVRAGDIIGVYTPIGYTDRHTIELAHMPRDIDPRTTCAQWCAWWQSGKHPTAEHLAEQRRQQLQARLTATPGLVKPFDVRCRELLDELEHTGELTPRVVAHLRAEMARSMPDISAYAYRLSGVGVCIWDDALARHSTAQEYDAYLEALAEIRSEADRLGGQAEAQAALGGQGE